MPSRALMVHDDRAESSLLGSYLAQHGFAIEHAGDLRRAMTLVDRTAFDAVLVDGTVAAIDTPRLLRRVRERRNTASVVIVDEASAARGDLDSYVDEWLRRPWHLPEALERVRLALSRRALAIATQHLIAGDFVLDVGERTARYRNDYLELTALEFDLVAVLARAVGHAVPRDALSEIVSERHANGSKRALDVHVCHLRAKLRAVVGGNPIRTVRGLGYALVIGDRGTPKRG